MAQKKKLKEGKGEGILYQGKQSVSSKAGTSGITLVALVVTVVVLLILAGITIMYVMGDNGIFGKAKDAGDKMEEQVARDKLEIVLSNLIIDKHIQKVDYNEKEYIDNKLLKEGMSAIDDIVIVDGYQFQIDRTVPKIVNSLGKGMQNEAIQIGEANIDYMASHYVKANMQIGITYNGAINEIIISGKKIEVPISQDGVYTISHEVEENGSYFIIVKDEEGNYKIGTIEVNDITEDMEIKDRETLKEFRSKVAQRKNI